MEEKQAKKKKAPAKKRIKRPTKEPPAAPPVAVAEPAPHETPPVELNTGGAGFKPHWTSARKREWFEGQLQGGRRLSEMRDSINVTAGRDGVRVADPIDQVQQQQDLEVAIRTADKETKKNRLIKAAIKRLDDGSFGTCIKCEEPIADQRLVAIPWAPRCISCETAHEQQGEEGETDERLVEAA